jgi:hypothetical protein
MSKAFPLLEEVLQELVCMSINTYLYYLLLLIVASPVLLQYYHSATPKPHIGTPLEPVAKIYL